ncbi:MAG: nucleoside hydrolase [Coriobacteriia bacterium]
MTGNKSVIIDFDNTMGVPGCDVDDGLALLFLLGNPELVSVVGATTTYGNNHLETVHANTEAMFDDLGLDIPLFRGCRDAEHPQSEASAFLARQAAEHPGEISVLATGSLTNLRGAQLLDPSFFANLREVVLMGGITQTLVFNGTIMDELNFSCDPIATKLVLSHAPRVATATGNNCLPAFFSAADFERRYAPSAENYLWRACRYWFRDMRERYGLDGFHCWDVVAAAYLTMPSLFDDCLLDVTMSETLLGVGYLEPATPGAEHSLVNTPKIREPREFVETMHAGWGRALELLGADA